MLRQIEGSRGVAEAVARCRPEVICAYPISPQTHIVEALSTLVKSGELAPCEFVNVESEFAAMSVAIGASAAGARAYTATASQGLLYMAEALYNASGLGLPIVMTVANRAIGAPINIWNDHSDAMSQRDSRLDPAVRRDEPGGARPAHPGVPDRRGAVAAGDGVHGRVRPHPRRRAGRRAGGRAGRRVPAAVRAAAGARPGRAGLDRRDGRPGGLHRGPVPGARQADAGARAHPARSPPSSPRRSAATPAAWSGRTGPRTPRPIVVALGSVLGTIKDTVDELRARGRADRRARAHLVPPVPAGRGPGGAARRASGSSCWSGRSRSASAASSSAERPDGAVRHPAARLHRHRRSRRPADHQGVAAPAVRRRGRRPARAADLPRPRHASWSSANCARTRTSRAARARPAENMLRDLGTARIG